MALASKKEYQSVKEKAEIYNLFVYLDEPHTLEFVLDVLSKVLSFNQIELARLKDNLEKLKFSLCWTGSKEQVEEKRTMILSYREYHSGEDIGPLRCSTTSLG